MAYLYQFKWQHYVCSRNGYTVHLLASAKKLLNIRSFIRFYLQQVLEYFLMFWKKVITSIELRIFDPTSRYMALLYKHIAMPLCNRKFMCLNITIKWMLRYMHRYLFRQRISATDVAFSCGWQSSFMIYCHFITLFVINNKYYYRLKANVLTISQSFQSVCTFIWCLHFKCIDSLMSARGL